MISAGDVARTAGANAGSRSSFDHCTDHVGMLGHAEVIVRAPDHNLAGTDRRMPDRVRKLTGNPLQIDEITIPAPVPKLVQGRSEQGVIVRAAKGRPCEAIYAANVHVQDATHPFKSQSPLRSDSITSSVPTNTCWPKLPSAFSFLG